jgi:hypothetical protein
MADKFTLVDIAAAPLLRCSELLSSYSPYLCGRPAPWMGNTGPNRTPAFHCDAHRHLADAPIAAGVTFVQVEIAARVRLAVAAGAAHLGQSDALVLLERAVRDVGGLLEVDRSDVQRCRYTPEWCGRGDSASESRR